jgi:hypothetical protein
VRLATFFEEPKVVHGRICRIDFVLFYPPPLLCCVARACALTYSEDHAILTGSPPSNDADGRIEALHRRLSGLEPRQVAAWRATSPARRLELAFQVYQFALGAGPLTEMLCCI